MEKVKTTAVLFERKTRHFEVTKDSWVAGMWNGDIDAGKVGNNVWDSYANRARLPVRDESLSLSHDSEQVEQVFLTF